MDTIHVEGTVDGGLVNLFVEETLEGQLSSQHIVHNDTDTEDIDTLVVFFLQQNLRSSVIRSPNIFFLSFEGLQGVFENGKSKIYDFDSINIVSLWIVLYLCQKIITMTF